ncbi:MAG: hypothetical protein ACOX3T_05925 [Bdellovibrionota bacterium]
MSPSGNTTILIDSPHVDSPKDRALISNKIMHNLHLGGEQVGFVSYCADGTPRLDMMEGEFCGNASRAFLAYLLDKGSPALKHETDESWTCEFSVSGVNKKLHETCFKTEKGIDALVELDNDIKYITKKYNDTLLDIIEMKGITHVLIDTDVLNFDEKNYIEISKQIRTNLNLEDLEAVGTIWYKQAVEEIKIFPIVWVKNTDSVFYETACGSGTAAIGIAKTLKDKKGLAILVRQPSNKQILVKTKINNGKITNISIGGIVDIIAKGELYIDDSIIQKLK